MKVFKHEHDTKLTPEPKTSNRQTRDRTEPTPLQFVTATEPSHFKGEKANRIVRSQATNWARRNTYGKSKVDQAALGDGSNEDKPTSGKSTKSQLKIEDDACPFLLDDTSVDRDGSPDEQCQSYAQTLRLWAATSVVNDNRCVKGWDNHASELSSPSWETCRGDSVRQHAVKEEPDDERSLDTEELKMRILIKHLARCSDFGNMSDPSDTLPRFMNPQLDSRYLIRHCLRAFVTVSMMERWLPAVLSDRHLILSSTLITSGWLDMQEGYPGETIRTKMVKDEVYAIAAEHLHDPNVTLKDASILVVDNLLIGEMWDLDENHLRMHQDRIAYLVHKRGGIQSSENATILEVSAACCFHTDLICNTEPSPIFGAWEPRHICPDPLGSLIELPSSCQDTAFSKSGPLGKLLYDMRDLGNLFIFHATTTPNAAPAKYKGTTRMSNSIRELNTRSTEILERLVNLPSASEPGHLMANHWIYESCRIAALIYAAAIKLRMSFPEAADPARNLLYVESLGLSGSYATNTSLSALLLRTLGRTDIENTWGDLAGVLYWVCIVGAMSARTSAMEQGRSTESDIWVRRCLSMHASRVLLMLVFPHTLPMAATAKKLLQVRQLVAPTRRRISIPSSTD